MGVIGSTADGSSQLMSLAADAIDEVSARRMTRAWSTVMRGGSSVVRLWRIVSHAGTRIAQSIQ
jgi:hypothetical protein